ncbi:GNAT family N-acetyltransferase [Pedobacter nyackensis]|uniref:GNAT family N-acetyltransferase n=1 Tax=Pedobacter nyackensis TaxID=475255 RepID=UPI00292FB864|nr:GNAT family N-acetyltransferase [Pedobacter nyackensis]
MNIRKAEISDASTIQALLLQLGYPTEDGFLAERIRTLSSNPDHLDLVYEENGIVIGFISFHFIPQIAFDGDYAVISYLVVDDKIRSRGVGAALEAYCTALAIEKKCKRVLVRSNIIRKDAHRFYLKQGYEEYQKAFVKKLS